MHQTLVVRDFDTIVDEKWLKVHFMYVVLGDDPFEGAPNVASRDEMESFCHGTLQYSTGSRTSTCTSVLTCTSTVQYSFYTPAKPSFPHSFEI